MGRRYKVLVDVEHFELLLTKYGTQMKALDLKNLLIHCQSSTVPSSLHCERRLLQFGVSNYVCNSLDKLFEQNILILFSPLLKEASAKNSVSRAPRSNIKAHASIPLLIEWCFICNLVFSIRLIGV